MGGTVRESRFTNPGSRNIKFISEGGNESHEPLHESRSGVLREWYLLKYLDKSVWIRESGFVNRDSRIDFMNRDSRIRALNCSTWNIITWSVFHVEQLVKQG